MSCYGGDARGGGARGKPAEEELRPAADSDGCSLLCIYLPLYQDTLLASVSLTWAHKDP